MNTLDHIPWNREKTQPTSVIVQVIIILSNVRSLKFSDSMSEYIKFRRQYNC